VREKKRREKQERSLTGTRVRDKIMVRYIAKMLVVVVHLGNMGLIGSLFPLVLVSYEEIESIDEVPGFQFHTLTKKTILSRLLLSNRRFAFPGKLAAA